jgi:beta-lactamase regulating signal transducer with metallopeptidase domain/tetratricopeptide (TPR) repeat protein
MLGWMLENTILACAIALMAIVVERRVRARPAVGHVMWLTVLLVLVLPPIALRSPVAVRGLFRPHIEDFEAAAWARLERTDPTLGWIMDSTTAGVFEGIRADDTSRDDLRADAAARPLLAQQVEEPSFDLAPLTEDHAGVASVAPAVLPTRSVMLPVAMRGLVRGVWLGGAILVLVLFLIRVRRIDRSVRRAAFADDLLLGKIRAVAGELGVRTPQTRVMPGAGTPMVWGLGRPVLIWPAELDIDADGSRGLVAHELAHLRRRDHWIALFEVFVSALLWWHPLARIAMSRMDRFAEQACDAWAVRALPGGRRDYAEALIGVVESLSPGRRVRPELAAGGQGRRALADRLGIVMRADASPSCSRGIVLGAIVLIGLLLPTISPAQPEDKSVDSVVATTIDDRLTGLVDAARLSREAGEWFDIREWDLAADGYAELLAIDPDRADARARHGIALMHLGRLNEAEEEIRAVLGESQKKAELHFWLAGVLSSQGRPGEAIVELEESIALGLDFAQRLRAEPVFERVLEEADAEPVLARAGRVHELRKAARASMRSRDQKAAIEALEEMAQLSPRDGSTWHFLSYARIAGGELDAALESLDRQRGLDHRSFVAEYNRACVFALLGKTQLAVGAFERAVELGFADYELAQKDPDLSSIRSDVRFQAALELVVRPARLKREMQVAREFADWDRVIVLCDELADGAGEKLGQWAMAQRARAVAERGDVDAAAEVMVGLIEDGYKVSKGLFGLGQIYAIAGDMDRAKMYLVAAARIGFDDLEQVEADPRLASVAEDGAFKDAFVGVVERRELSSFRVTSWEALEARARNTLDAHPDVAQAKHELGWSLLRQDRYEEAETLFRGLAESGWNVAASSYNVACTAALAGDRSLAMDWLEKAADAGLDNPDLFVTDRDLRSLRHSPRFEALVERLRDEGGR